MGAHLWNHADLSCLWLGSDEEGGVNWRCFFGHDERIENGPDGMGIYRYEREPAAGGQWVHKSYKTRCYKCGLEGFRQFAIEFGIR